MRLAAQLYSVREFTKTAEGFDATLQTIHGIGFEGVQLSAVGCMNIEDPEVDAQMARQMLDANGLVCCATHRPWERLRDHLEAEIAFHKALGCDYIAIGSLGGHYAGMAGMRQFLAEAPSVIDALAAEGIKFGYHNHDHEFRLEPDETHCQYELLLSFGPALKLEVDVYWVAVGGKDPQTLLVQTAGRIPVVHLKDRNPDPYSIPNFAAVGEGDLDWGQILSACEIGGTEWAVVEQDDCPRDPFDCLNSSFEFLISRV